MMLSVKRLPAYLASPYSAIGDFTPELKAEIREARYRQALKAAHWMMGLRLWVYSPIVHCHEIAKLNSLPTDAKFWQSYNEDMIDSFQSVVVLCEEGWTVSVGVQMEIEYAQKFYCDLMYLVPKRFISDELKHDYQLLDHAPLNVV